jgi:purine-nucleoside phosphorylase
MEPKLGLRAQVGVVLGSGLGAFAEELSNPFTVPYKDLEGFPISTAAGHAGKLVVGNLGGVDVAVLAGRSHLYEGYSAAQVTEGIRLLHGMGVASLLVTNASGGIAAELEPGDLTLITDHINLQGANPLIGPHAPFPDMTEAYSLRLRNVAKEAAAELGITLREGVYAAVVGPCYETPAEIRYLKAIGADLVGMSTVLEVIMANALKMEVLGISCVTNKAAGLSGAKLQHDEVLEVGRQARARFADLVKAIVPGLPAGLAA